MPKLPARFLLALAVVLSAASSAQQVTEPQRFPAERLRISTNREGLIDVEDASVARHLTLDAGMWLGYARNPLLVYRLADNARLGPLVESRLGAELVASVGLYDRFEVGIDLPVILYQGRPGDIPEALQPGLSLTSLSTTGVGDLRLLGKWQLLHQKDSGINLAIMPALTLPSGFARAYFGDSGPVFAPEVLLSWGRDHLRAGANLGAALRGKSRMLNATIGSELTGHFGGGYRFQAEDGTGGPPLELDASLSMSASAVRPFQSSNETHLELRGMAAYDLGHSIPVFGDVKGSMQVFGGVGLGLVRGWGTPDWRLFAGVRYGKAPPPPPPEQVKVAVVEPPDRDHDGIVDSKDACPDEPETVNGYQDEDGCPDQPPPPPDPDRDGDGVPDRIDNCPDEPGPASNQGCVEKQLVQITVERLEILEKIYFKIGRTVIEKRSYQLLENVVAVLKAHPELKHVLVEGHTDSQGPLDYNQELSENRARAVVKFLVQHGVERERLNAAGFGPTRPVADNATPDGREKNRRVVFTILDENGAPQKEEGAKPEGAKPETPKAETPKAETPKAETPKAETPKAETPKTETPKTETPKTETPKTEPLKPEPLKPEPLKPEPPKPESPKQVQP